MKTNIRFDRISLRSS